VRIKQSYDVTSQSKSRGYYNVRAVFLQRSIGERNHGAIFNEQSLASYTKDSSASQNRACSDTLSRPFLSREASDVNTACSSSMAGGEVHVSFAASSQTHSVQTIMPNCQFSNCTINFNTYK